MPAIMVRIGTCTNDGATGILTFLLGEDGSLTPAGVTPVLNPSHIITNEDGSRLYAALEVAQWNGETSGAVASYAVEGSAMRLLNTQPTGAPGPCHLLLHDGMVYTACFSGALAALPLAPDGSLQPAATTRAGDLPCAPAGVASHFHQTLPLPGAQLCVMDMGMDRLFLFPAGDTTSTARVRAVEAPTGAGPRHGVLAADGRFLYVCGELDNHVLVYALQGEELNQVQRVDALPPGWSETSYCGPIRLSPDGRFLLVGNRGQNAIAVFQVEANGLLGALRWFDCGGNFPRDMAFTPDGRFVLCANQRGNTLSVLRFHLGDGSLTPVGDVPAQTPTCICFDGKEGNPHE